MRSMLILFIIAGLIALPLEGVHAMPVQSAGIPDNTPITEHTGGYYYAGDYYGNHALLLVESILYVGLCLAALIILDEHTENITIIIKDE